MLLQCTQDVPYKLHYNIFLQPLLFIGITLITCGSIKLSPQKRKRVQAFLVCLFFFPGKKQNQNAKLCFNTAVLSLPAPSFFSQADVPLHLEAGGLLTSIVWEFGP